MAAPNETEQIISAAASNFNSLPRSPLDSSVAGTNHWHFSLRPVLLDPPDTLLFMVCQTGRIHVVRLPVSTGATIPLNVQARLSAVLLLGAFSGDNLRRSRPCSWSTDSIELARGVSTVMKQIGVGDGLDHVGITEQWHQDFADTEWMKYFANLLGTNFH